MTELFLVNRYDGEDGTDNSERKQSILERLKSEAETRKILRQKASGRDSFTPITKPHREQSSSEKKSHSKKSKRKPTNTEVNAEFAKKTKYDQPELRENELDQHTKDEGHIEEETEDHYEPQEGPHTHGGFTVLGESKSKSTEKVQRTLPYWIAHPNVISVDLKHMETRVDEMPCLDDCLVQKLTQNGIKSFFPVQYQVIPVLMKMCMHGADVGMAGLRPNDICVSAPTGSGKTLAFVLPIIQTLKCRVVQKVRALAVLPVRDLAAQVFRVFQTYCEGTGLKVALLSGQHTFTIEQNHLVKLRSRGYLSNVDIIVTTPGRIVDHILKTDGLDLSYLRFLIIDEADRMMDDIKHDWLHHVTNAVFKGHRKKPGPVSVSSSSESSIPLQKLLFSATLSQNPEKLEQLQLFQPKLFTSVVRQKDMQSIKEMATHSEGDKKQINNANDFVGKYTTPAELTEQFTECLSEEKPLIILFFLLILKYRRMLVFTDKIEAAHRLYMLVKIFGGVKVQEFSSHLKGTKRDKVIKNFSKGKIDLLICSDAMARGIDIENVHYVVSYDAPTLIKTYIHRIGRTARAGKEGTAITLLEKKQFYHFKKMLDEAGKARLKELRVKRESLESMVPPFQDALKQLSTIVETEKLKMQQVA